MQTPVTIFGGYLGSGKTTIILNALKQYKEPVKFAMIKNEYGDVNVDAQLMRASNIQVKEIVNGCLCCILVGELNPGIDELIKTQQPERLIIEASGNALPFPIVRELRKNPQVYVDGVVVVVDCLNFERLKDKSVVAREQAKYTDLIIFNKTGLVDENKLYHVKEEIFDLNPDTVKVDTSDGMVDPHVLFGLPHQEAKWNGLMTEVSEDHNHHHDVESFVWQTQNTKVLQVQKVQEVLKACNPNAFYRIKGIVKDDKGTWQLLNVVFGRIEWREMPSGTSQGEQSRIVFIGQGIKQWEPAVRDYLDKAVM
jgi:G3E family GTPase